MKKRRNLPRNLVIRMFTALLVLAMVLGAVPVSAASKSVKVTTKKKLVAELKKSNSETIVFTSKTSGTVTIPAIKAAKNKKLVINASKAKIVNKSALKSITLEACGTFTEKASGNKITLKDKNTVFKLASGKKMSKLTVSAAKANISVAKKAAISDLVCNKKSASVKLDVASGSDVNVNLSKKTSIEVTGSAKADVDITASAKSSSVTTSVPVDLDAKDDLKLNLAKGSEGSVINSSKSVSVKVDNNSSETPTIKEDGKVVSEAKPVSSDSNVNDDGNTQNNGKGNNKDNNANTNAGKNDTASGSTGFGPGLSGGSAGGTGVVSGGSGNTGVVSGGTDASGSGASAGGISGGSTGGNTGDITGGSTGGSGNISGGSSSENISGGTISGGTSVNSYTPSGTSSGNIDNGSTSSGSSSGNSGSGNGSDGSSSGNSGNSGSASGSTDPIPVQTPEQPSDSGQTNEPGSSNEVSPSPSASPVVSTSPEASPSPSENPETSPSPIVNPETSPSPSETPEPSPSPSETPETSPSPSESPETSPSPSVNPETSPSPSVNPETSPSPSVDPETSPSPSVNPETSPSPSVTTGLTPTPDGSATLRLNYGQTQAREMLDLINQYRSSHGSGSSSTKALIYDYDLEKAAMQRAAEIAVRFEEDNHYRPDGYTYEKTLQEYGFDISPRNILYAENILSYPSENPSMEEAFNALATGETGSIICSESNYVGIGHIRINKTDYWVQLFSNEEGRSSTYCDALDGQKDININIPNRFVESVTPVYVSGENSVAVGSTVAVPRYTAKVTFVDSDAGEIPVVGNLVFESQNEFVEASNGMMTGLKAGASSISAQLLGKTVSVNINVTGTSTLQQLIDNAESYPNTVLSVSDSEIAKSEADVYKLIYDKVTGNYTSGSVIVDSFDLLKAEDEYAQLFPSVKSIVFSNAKIYKNVSAVTCTITYKENSFFPEERATDYSLTNDSEAYLTSSDKELYDKVVSLADTLKGNTEYDTVKNIHDYLVKKIAYTMPQSAQDMSVYSVRGALFQLQCVCDGYAKSFYLLCKACGVEAIYVTGTATNSTGVTENHAWNKVKIADKWYAIDCTWDDPVPDNAGVVLYPYFLITDQDMATNHVWDDTDLPDAISTDLGIIYQSNI